MLLLVQVCVHARACVRALAPLNVAVTACTSAHAIENAGRTLLIAVRVREPVHVCVRTCVSVTRPDGNSTLLFVRCLCIDGRAASCSADTFVRSAECER